MSVSIRSAAFGRFLLALIEGGEDSSTGDGPCRWSEFRLWWCGGFGIFLVVIGMKGAVQVVVGAE